MKADEPMDWTKRQVQEYGVFMAILGGMLGALLTVLAYQIFVF